MSKAAQGFLTEAYFLYVEGGNPRRTPLIGKIAIYGWKLCYTKGLLIIMVSFLPGPTDIISIGVSVSSSILLR